MLLQFTSCAIFFPFLNGAHNSVATCMGTVVDDVPSDWDLSLYALGIIFFLRV